MRPSTSNFSWDGLVLIGGHAIVQGNASVQGALITGLNVKLGDNLGNDLAGNQLHGAIQLLQPGARAGTLQPPAAGGERMD